MKSLKNTNKKMEQELRLYKSEASEKISQLNRKVDYYKNRFDSANAK